MSSIKNKLVGRWRLVSYVANSEQGETVYPLGPVAKGVLDYSREGHVSVHIMGAGYFAYYGYYSVDEKASTVALEGARLVLSGSMDLNDRPHAIRVVWERQAE